MKLIASRPNFSSLLLSRKHQLMNEPRFASYKKIEKISFNHYFESNKNNLPWPLEGDAATVISATNNSFIIVLGTARLVFKNGFEDIYV